LVNIPSVKIGPADSARSHMADEYIYLSEIKEGIELYVKMLELIALKAEPGKSKIVSR